MNLEELIEAARVMVDDVERGLKDQLWSDADWTRYANRRQREASRRARLLVDSTSDLTKVTLAAGVAVTKLDPRILFLRRVRLAARPVFLGRVSHHRLDCEEPSWEDETGEPRAYVPDMDTGALRPYPIPIVDTEVRLTVVRLPLKDLKDGKDVPEIASHLHDALVDGMVAEAFMKKDSEAFDPTRAADHEAAFTAEFGPKSSAIDEAWLQREHDYLPAEGNF